MSERGVTRPFESTKPVASSAANRSADPSRRPSHGCGQLIFDSSPSGATAIWIQEVRR
jgi:hypothetical protein